MLIIDGAPPQRPPPSSARYCNLKVFESRYQMRTFVATKTSAVDQLSGAGKRTSLRSPRYVCTHFTKQSIGAGKHGMAARSDGLGFEQRSLVVTAWRSWILLGFSSAKRFGPGPVSPGLMAAVSAAAWLQSRRRSPTPATAASSFGESTSSLSHLTDQADAKHYLGREGKKRNITSTLVISQARIHSCC